MRGRIDVVRELITAQPDSSQIVLDGGETVLHICVKYNQIEAPKLLVESLSDEGNFFNSKDHDGGNTILHVAVMLKKTKVGFFTLHLLIYNFSQKKKKIVQNYNAISFCR